MNCHYHQILLAMAAMDDFVLTDAGCGGHLPCTFVKLVAGVSDE